MSSLCRPALFCLAFFVAAATVRAAGRPQRQNSDATFYYFARTWPQTTCDLRRCVTRPQSPQFTTSGLWPASASTPTLYETYCNGPDVPAASRKQVAALLPELQGQWPWFTEVADEVPYLQAYKKHGSCNINQLSAPDFLSTAMELHQRYPFTTALEDANIVPSETAAYSVGKLQRILASMWGVKPIVKRSCPSGWGAECGEAPLDSILICIDWELNAVDCSSVCTGATCERTNCNSVSLPPLRQWQGGAARRAADIQLAVLERPRPPATLLPPEAAAHSRVRGDAARVS